jgi:hypothetical protein
MNEKINGELIIIIYFPTTKNNYSHVCKIFLESSLPRYLKDYAKEIRPLIFSLIKFSSFKTLKTAGCQYVYIIEDATPEFFEKMYDFLDRKKKMNEFLNSYSTIFGHFIDRGSF